jgi:hypothetical protein
VTRAPWPGPARKPEPRPPPAPGPTRAEVVRVVAHNLAGLAAALLALGVMLWLIQHVGSAPS